MMSLPDPKREGLFDAYDDENDDEEFDALDDTWEWDEELPPKLTHKDFERLN